VHAGGTDDPAEATVVVVTVLGGSTEEVVDRAALGVEREELHPSVAASATVVMAEMVENVRIRI
jgi:hypothetical protein